MIGFKEFDRIKPSESNKITIRLKDVIVDRSLFVFDSHSSRDNNGMAFLDSMFSSTKHQRFRYSFTENEPPHSETIKKAIGTSSSVIVTLSRFMTKPHTAMWVGYEVGTAHDLSKNIIVFENFESDWINLPVPYVDAYIQRPKKLTSFSEPFKTIAESAGMQFKPDTKPKNALYADFITCPNPNCKSKYYGMLYKMPFPCPVCKHEIKASNLDIDKVLSNLKEQALAFDEWFDRSTSVSNVL